MKRLHKNDVAVWAFGLLIGCAMTSGTGHALATDKQPAVRSPAMASKITAPRVAGTPATKTATKTATIPASILAEAKRRGLAAHTIKRQGDQWVACESSGSVSESCVVLGNALPSTMVPSGSTPANSTTSNRSPHVPTRLTSLRVGDVLQVHQYGQALRSVAISQAMLRPNTASGLADLGQLVSVDRQNFEFQMRSGIEARVTVPGKPSQVIDTLPRYRREGDAIVRTRDFKLVKDYIDSHPNEGFMVLVTVPSLCEPCRQMDRMLEDTLPINLSGSLNGPAVDGTIKTFVLEYFTFADAEREVLGPGALFPTTLVYAPAAQSPQTVKRVIGSLQNVSVEEMSRALRGKVRRGTPHTLSRGLLSRDLILSLRRSAR